METISTTFKVDRLHQIKSVRRVLEKSNDNMSILSRDVIIGANAYLYTNRNILLTTFIKKDSNGKAIATIDTDFGLGSIYAGVNVFGKGDYSLNIGKDNNVNTNYSAAIGTGLVPTTNNGIVIGQYNKTDTQARYVVIGGGTSDKNRKDLVTINTAGVTEINNSDNANGLNTGALRVIGGILSQGTNYFTNITRITQSEDAEETLQKAAADTGALRVTGGIYSGGKNWFANRTVINNSADANSTGTQGALNVKGGIHTGGINYFNGVTNITQGDGSTGSTTGALRVTGGIYTGKENFFNNNTTITGVAKITKDTSADAANTGALQVTGGIYSGGKNWFASRTVINDNNAANSDGTQGALTVAGGIYVGKDSYFNGVTNITKTEGSTGSTSGALRLAGGIYTGKKNYFEDSTAANSNEAALYVVGGIYTGKDNYFDSDTTITGITKITNEKDDALQIKGGITSSKASFTDLTATEVTIDSTENLKFPIKDGKSKSLATLLSEKAPAETTVQIGSDKLGNLGSTIIPVYVSGKTVQACKQYAGGTEVTLNGEGKGANTASFYAPTTSGFDDYILQAQQNGEPQWISPDNVTVGNAVSAQKLTTTSAGSSTQPIYFSNGVPVASTLNCGESTKPVYFANGEITLGSLYAGGTEVTLNGTLKGANTASFYAPTTSGNDKQVLISKGANKAPVWVDASGLAVSSATTATKLATSRNLKVNLASSKEQTFNGTSNADKIGVSGILPVAHGGTGVSQQNWLSHNSEPSLPFTIYHTFNTIATLTAEKAGLTPHDAGSSCYFVDFPIDKFANKDFEDNTILEIRTSDSSGWGTDTLCGFTAWNDKAYAYSENGATTDSHLAKMTVHQSVKGATNLRIFMDASYKNALKANLIVKKTTGGIVKRAIFQINANGTTSVYNPTTKALKTL